MMLDELDCLVEVGGGNVSRLVENIGRVGDDDSDVFMLVVIAVTRVGPQAVLVAQVSTTIVDEDLDFETGHVCA